MNKFGIILLTLLLQFVVTMHVSADDLSKGKIGPLKTGLHIFKLAKYDTNALVKRKQFEEDFFLEYSFRLEKLGIVYALLGEDDLTVYKLSTKSENLTTAEGAHVGMSLNHLKKIYPQGKLVTAWDSIENLYGFILPEQKGVFVFNVDSIMNQCAKEYPKCENYMGEIKSIEYFTFDI
ncbi:MAG: hypothetical protein L3J46_05250 [Kangiellaceae bacterium]|nr:hypothetical protein [Kangiellaceae bacterium]